MEGVKEMAGSSSRHVDPVTGYETTGHEWNGIIELNTPFPRIVIWALLLSLLFSAAVWILFPAWPTGTSYTRGLLGFTQEGRALKDLEELSQEQVPWRSRVASKEFGLLKNDDALKNLIKPGAERLFADNCAACHGQDGGGKPGFPSLRGHTWLWGGSPESIAETITVGINSSDPDTRVSQMPAFGTSGMLTRSEIDMIAEYVVSISRGTADAAGPGGRLFANNCSACHGDGGRGGVGVGAPALTAQNWIYGGTHSAIVSTIQYGRQGVMPAWRSRLSESDIHILALYVSWLGGR